MMGRGRGRALSERDLEPDLALGASGRAMELEGSDALLLVVVVMVVLVGMVVVVIFIKE